MEREKKKKQRVEALINAIKFGFERRYYNTVTVPVQQVAGL